MAISFPFSIIPIYQKETLPKTYRNIAFQLNIFLCWLITPVRALFCQLIGLTLTFTLLSNHNHWSVMGQETSKMKTLPRLTWCDTSIWTAFHMSLTPREIMNWLYLWKVTISHNISIFSISQYLTISHSSSIQKIHLVAQFFVPQDEEEEEKICQKSDQCHLIIAAG